MKKNYLRLLVFPFIFVWSFSTPRGYEVNIKQGEETPMTVYTKEENVGELMRAINLEYDMLDVFSEKIDSEIYDGMNIVIDDVEYKVEEEQEITPYETKTIKTDEVGLWSTEVLQEGISEGKSHFYRTKYVNGDAVGSEFIETIVNQKKQDKIIGIGTGNPGSFTGTITGYGPDCKGCSGVVACSPYPNVSNNINFNDSQYGTVRIIAADRSIPCGTVMKISGIYGQPITAIVLDRGSAIVGKTADLLFPSENDTVAFGRKYNIKYNVVRWGW